MGLNADISRIRRNTLLKVTHMELLIYPLILAAITGLTVVAYKQPEFYEDNFDGKIFFSAVGAIIISSVWDIATAFSFSTLKEFIPEEKFENAEKAISVIEISTEVELGIWLLFAFSLFLSWLANKSLQRNHRE